MTDPHPWRRYVALGDSFTEGIGDPEPESPGGYRGGLTGSQRCSRPRPVTTSPTRTSPSGAY